MKSSSSKKNEKANSAPLSNQERLRAAQISQIYNQSYLGGFGASVGAVIFAGAMWHAQPRLGLIVWALVYCIHFAFHRYLVIRFRKVQPAGRDIFKWGLWHRGTTSCGGLLWGYVALFLFPHNFEYLQMFLIIFIGGIVAGGVALYAPTSEYLQNILFALLPLAGHFFYHGGGYNITLGILLLMYGSVMGVSGSAIHTTYAELLTLRFQRQDLIEELKGEIDWRKKIEQDLTKARDELEVRVQERTAEIATVNENLLSEIDERKKIEVALRVSEEAYRSLSENIPGIVYRYWPSTNSIKYFNSRLEQMTGFPKRKLASPIDSPLESLVVDEDRAFVYKVTSNALIDRKPFEISYRIRTSSGATRWVTNYGCSGSDKEVESDYIDGVIFDITDRKISEERVKESEAKYRLLVDNAQEAIFVVQDGFVRFFNPRTTELLGFSPDELKVTLFENIVNQNDKNQASFIFAQDTQEKSPQAIF
ncbi:MAG: PAS domain S-box protein, partial [Desulfomonilaceae bacterium]